VFFIREEEEDMMLSAVIQRTGEKRSSCFHFNVFRFTLRLSLSLDLLAQKDKQLDKFNRTFKGLQMFKTSSCKTKNSSRKKSS